MVFFNFYLFTFNSDVSRAKDPRLTAVVMKNSIFWNILL